MAHVLKNALVLVAVTATGCAPPASSSNVVPQAGGADVSTLLCDNGSGVQPFHLDRCAGKYSYLSVMTENGGLKNLIDADGAQELHIADAATAAAADAKFAPDVKRKLLKVFRGGQEGFDGLLGALQGRSATPLQMAAAIRTKLTDATVTKPVPLAAVMIAPYLSIASGGGSDVWLDESNHFVNIGYGPGTVEHDVKTGRSFSGPGTRGLLDASDPFYLDALESYLKSGDRAGFYRALFQLLTASDPSGIKSLSPEGQALLTDFIAVYTAELDRHIMVHFTAHPWHNDLAEATYVSSFIVSSGKWMKKGALVDGKPGDLFAVGATGSGIGNTRRDRYDLQRAICAYYWAQSDTTEIQHLADLVGAQPGGDVLHALSLTFSNTEKAGQVLQNAAAISEAAAAFMVRIGNDAPAIVEHITSGAK